MATDNLAKKALRYILDYRYQNFDYPSNQHMAEVMGGSNNWGNYRRRLFDDGKLIESDIDDFQVPDSVWETYKKSLLGKPKPPVIPKASARNFEPVQVPIYGEVRAGKDREADDLIVDLSPSGETVELPAIDPGQEVYALIVSGDSMVSDHIVKDDLIIAEKISLANLQQGDLIVAKCLKPEYNQATDEELEELISDPKNFLALTLKYYSHRQLKVGKKVKTLHKLSPKNNDKRYTIETQYIDENELGRVIAVHRLVRAGWQKV